MTRPLSFAFAMVTTTAVLLSAAAGLLVTASLFIADRAPETSTWLGIHLGVSAVFLTLALLMAGIGWQLLQLNRIAATIPHPSGDALRRKLGRLLALLTVTGLGLSGFLAILTWGILSRIDEGFAVFG